MPQLTIQQAFALALRHHQAGQLQQAEQIYRQILAQQPGNADALHFLGLLAHQVGQNDMAVDLIRQAIALKPNFPGAYSNLGLALKAQGQHDEAIAVFRQAIALKPHHLEAYSNLGIALKDRGQLDEAIAAYRQAIAFNPNLAEVHNNLGNALREKGQFDAALAAYRQTVALKPDYPEAQLNLGNVLSDKAQFDEAIAAYRQAIALKPHFTGAYNNLGSALKNQGQLDEAIATYRQALALAPANAAIHSNLIYALHFHPAYDAPALAAEHRRWNLQHAAPLKRFIPPHTNDRSPERRLRIGYVSPDFRIHPVGRFMVPLLAGHDHQGFEVFAYAQVPAPDALTEQLRTHTDQWRSIVGLSDEQAAQLIRDDRIDILIDLTMHMASNRMLVFARKPAPVQVTYLAYCSTTGLSTMDYRLSDPYLDPPGMEESVYSEKTIRLPQTYWCYQPALSPPLAPLPALQAGHITFGSFNNFCKVTTPTLMAWARLLQAVPQSQLLLHAHEGAHRQRTADLLARLGVDPRRLHFAGHVPLAEYVQLYQQIDIALDTFPYGGGTTTCDALWMGVPVVSLAGNTAVGRGGVSILSNIGLPELVAPSEDAYVRIAAALANDLPRLTDLRATLRQRMAQSPLMDAPRFVRGIEAAYRDMWRKWCAQIPAQTPALR